MLNHRLLFVTNVSATPVTVIRVSYNENTVNTQIVVKMYDKAT